MHNYDDIINLPHYEPKNHPRMSITSRSAIFAPFSALTGFKEEIVEKARITKEKEILSETRKEEINNLLNYLNEHVMDSYNVRITYYEKDLKKSGGRYQTIINVIKKIDTYKRLIILKDYQKINIDDLYYLEILDNKYFDIND